MSDVASATTGLAFLAGAAVTMVLVLFAYIIYLLRSRLRKTRENVGIAGTSVSTVSTAWVDPELGQGGKGVPADVFKHLRRLLEEEVFKGPGTCELARRLERLEQKEGLSPRLLRDGADASVSEVNCKGPPKASPTVETRTPNSSSEQSGGSSPRAEDIPGTVTVLVSPAPPLPPRAAEKARPPVPTPPMLPPPVELPAELPGPSLGKEFGPTEKQLRLPKPPEKVLADMDEEASQAASLHTLQQILAKRDAQTTELHKQLREARQALWLQTADARAATSRLDAFLADPSKAPDAQAEALQRMQHKIRELSGRLAETRWQEQQWGNVAKRQHAFMLQCERMAKEGADVLPRCGLLDEEGGPTAWDVATSHCNPYAVDSWPFEPNSLAQRPSQEPNLNRWDEGDDDVEEDHDDDCEDHVLHRWGQYDTMTVQGGRGRPDDDEPYYAGEDDELEENQSWTRASATQGSETARSL